MAGIGLIAGANQFQFKEKYDALKAADQKTQLAYPNKNLAANEAKQKDLTSLTTLLGTFKGEINSLVNGEVYAKSKVDTIGESASFEAKKGVSASTFTINVQQLAKQDAYQTNKFSSEVHGIFNDLKIKDPTINDNVMLENTSFKISVGKEEFEIKVNANDSLQSISDKLLSATNQDNKKLSDLINVKVLDVGGDNYSLMITSKKAGKDNEINFAVAENTDSNPNNAAFSSAVLERLGFSSSVKASSIKKELSDIEKDIKANETILKSNAYDIGAYVSGLTNSKTLEYTKADGSKGVFELNKDTKLSSLSKEQLDSVYSAFLEDKKNEYIKNNSVPNPLGLSDQELMKNTIDSLVKNLKSPLEIKYTDSTGVEKTLTLDSKTKVSKLNDEELKAAFDDYNEKQFQLSLVKDWVGYVKNTGEELNIEYTDKDGKTQTFKINKDTDINNLSEEQIKHAYSFIDEKQKSLFNSVVQKDKLESELKSVSENDKNHVQTAQNAEFEYQGVKISRSTNDIEDLIVGAKITLKKDGETTFKVGEDSSALVDAMKEFAKNYNEIVNSLATMTDFDKEKKTAGNLQGVNEVSRLKSQLSQLITKADANNMSLSSLGFELNEKGILTFKESTFKDKFDKDPELVKKFLTGSDVYEKLSYSSGEIKEQVELAEGDFKINGKNIAFEKDFLDKLKEGKVEKGEYINQLIKVINDAKIEGVTAKINQNGGITIESDGKRPLEISGDADKLAKLSMSESTQKTVRKEQVGIFNRFKETLDSLVGSNGSLNKLSESLEDEQKKIKKDIEQINKDIERRYEILAAKLNSYDVLLNKYAQQGQTINALIESAFANK